MGHNLATWVAGLQHLASQQREVQAARTKQKQARKKDTVRRDREPKLAAVYALVRCIASWRVGLTGCGWVVLWWPECRAVCCSAVGALLCSCNCNCNYKCAPCAERTHSHTHIHKHTYRQRRCRRSLLKSRPSCRTCHLKTWLWRQKHARWNSWSSQQVGTDI